VTLPVALSKQLPSGEIGAQPDTACSSPTHFCVRGIWEQLANEE
jgi:hypothetical protein